MRRSDLTGCVRGEQLDDAIVVQDDDTIVVRDFIGGKADDYEAIMLHS
jgi:hypothetical protein